MEGGFLLGTSFLEKVVEWSELEDHSGKFYCSLEEKSEDCLGYIAVGANVTEYIVKDSVVTLVTGTQNAHLEHLKSILQLPFRPHSSARRHSKKSALTRVSRKLKFKNRLTAIQRRVNRGFSYRDEKDPLGVCLNSQMEAINDFCRQYKRFPDRAKMSTCSGNGLARIDFGRLPLSSNTCEAIRSVYFGNIQLLGGQKGLVFKFRYFSRRRNRFEH